MSMYKDGHGPQVREPSSLRGLDFVQQGSGGPQAPADGTDGHHGSSGSDGSSEPDFQQRYWLRKRDSGEQWGEVSMHKFIEAERAAGFWAKGSEYKVATGGFGNLSHPIEGRVTTFGKDANDE